MPNPFAHTELTTDNLKLAQTFYKKVFAWKLTEVPGMDYTMIDVQGGAGGGMQGKPMPEAPTGWMPYVQVDDVNATLTKASKAGASVVLPYQEIGEMGSIAIFADPTGCRIGIWASQVPPAPAPSQRAAAPAKKAVAKKAPPPAKKAVAKKAAAPAKKAVAKKAAAPAKKAVAKKAAASAAKKKK